MHLRSQRFWCSVVLLTSSPLHLVLAAGYQGDIKDPSYYDHSVNPLKTNFSVQLNASCLLTYYDSNNIPQFVLLPATLVNGRVDTRLANGPVPPGFNISSFSVQTSVLNPPENTVSATVSIDPNTPVGEYFAPLVGDMAARALDPPPAFNCAQSAETPNFFSGSVGYYMSSVTYPPLRNGFDTVSITGSPTTALSASPAGLYPNATLEPIGFGQNTEQTIILSQGTMPLACQDHGTTALTTCPIATVTPPFIAAPTATFSIQPPVNPSGLSYHPGQTTAIALGSSYGGVVTGGHAFVGAIGVAGTTFYITAGESTFNFPPNCLSITHRVNGVPVILSGAEPGTLAWPNNPELANGNYCKAFPYFVALQGSGKFENPANPRPDTTFHFLNGSVQEQSPLLDADSDELIPYGTIARDPWIIPKTTAGNPYSVHLEGTNVGGPGVSSISVQASDTGQAFISRGANNGFGYNHFDVYTGIQHYVNAPQNLRFTSPMVLFGCDQQVPAPPSMAKLGYQTLCPLNSQFSGFSWMIGEPQLSNQPAHKKIWNETYFSIRGSAGK